MKTKPMSLSPSMLSLFGLACLLFMWVGCASNNPNISTDPSQYADDQLYVWVDGRVRGAVPATIRIRRSFSEYLIMVKKNNRTLRTYEVEQLASQHTSSVAFSFSGDTFGGILGYDLRDLPVVDDTLHIIPNMGQPIQVDDHEFGLTLIIEN